MRQTVGGFLVVPIFSYGDCTQGTFVAGYRLNKATAAMGEQKKVMDRLESGTSSLKLLMDFGAAVSEVRIFLLCLSHLLTIQSIQLNEVAKADVSITRVLFNVSFDSAVALPTHPNFAAESRAHSGPLQKAL